MGPDRRIATRILPTELIRVMHRIIRTVNDRLTDDQINSPTKTMKIDRIMEFAITKMGHGETMEIFLTRHHDKDEIFHKVSLFADLNLFNIEIRHLEDQTVIQPLVPLLINKSFRQLTINPQRTWSALPPLKIALPNCQNFVC